MAKWAVGAAGDLPIEMRDSWDGPAIKSHIFEWAGFNGDNPDPNKAKRAFLIHDTENPKLKGSYKLPFADVVDGNLKAISSGIHAASSRLPQTDAPEEVLNKAKKVLEAYKARMDDSKAAPAIDAEEIHATQVRVARSTIMNPTELKSRAESRARNGYKFADDELYFWSVDASNNRVDTYFTAMDGSSLKNYAADAEEGVAFQNSHLRHQLPFGSSLAAKYTGGSSARTAIDFYTVRGLNLNGVNTDELIRGMETGILNDVSIGFYGGWYRCSICGKNMMDWTADWSERCRHIPGIEYDITDKQGNVTDRQQCIAHVMDARLSEVSVVYDGACPGAAIRKAYMESEAGELRSDVATLLEQRYRIKLRGSRKIWAPAVLEDEDDDMPVETREPELLTPEVPEETRATAEEENETPVPVAETRATETQEPELLTPVTEERAPVVQEAVDPTVQLRSAMTEAGINPGEDPVSTLRALADEVRRNRKLAKDGAEYRKYLIEDAIKEGIRALGETFNVESYNKLLADASIDTIKEVRDSFAKTASENFKSGRETTETEEPLLDSKVVEIRKNRRPAAVFANG